MKNISLSIDDRIFAAVIKYAADHDCSVNSLVSEYFVEIANREYQIRKARLEIKRLSAQSSARIGSRFWKRDDLYER